MRLTVSLRRMAFWLVAVLIILSVAGIYAEYARYYLYANPQLVNYFSLTEEKNFPTWWSSFLLFACGMVLFAIGSLKSRAKGDFRRHWIVLGWIFCYMSVDELVEIHEWLNAIPGLGHLHGAIFYGWVIPAAAVVLIFAVSYLRFLFHLPMRTRIMVAASGVIYVGGAMGIELILGLWADKHGERNFSWAMIGYVEEAGEIVGSSMFLYTLTEYLGQIAPELFLAIRSGPALREGDGMTEAVPEKRSWFSSPWVKWSWLVVLAVVIAVNADFQFRFLPTSAEGYSARGRVDYNAGEYERAVENFTKVIDKDPGNVEAYIWRGVAYAKERDIVHALPDVEKALKLSPGYNKAEAAYADVLAAAWDDGGAIEAYTKVLADSPGYVRCYLARGKCYYFSGKLAEARADLDKAVTLATEDPDVTSILLRWSVRAHAGDAYGASLELADLMKENKIRGDRFWMSAQFLTGEVTESNFLSAMPKIKDSDEHELAAEASYLAGVKRLVFGDREGAVALLRKALDVDAGFTNAYDAARAELETLLLGFHPVAQAQPDAGMKIGSVVPGSAAELAGIRPGATLEKIGDAPATQDAVLELLAKGELGSTVMLSMIVDGGKPGTVPLPFRLEPSEPTK